MIAVSDKLKEKIKASPFYREGLRSGLFNLSALARVVRPDIEKLTKKKVKEITIIMALKRLSEKLEKGDSKLKNRIFFSEVTVRKGLVEISYYNTETLKHKLGDIFQLVEKFKESVFNFTQGVSQSTFIISDNLKEKIKRILSEEREIAEINDISSISMKYSEDIVETPGVYSYILNILALEEVNIIEVISTYTDLNIYFRTKDVYRAFEIINNINRGKG